MKKSHIHLKSPGTRNDKQKKQKYASAYVGTVASNKFWSSMSFQNLVRLSQI
jgi:hypothetical protein